MATETPPPLLERQRELAELGSALTEARQGRGQVVLIEASAGLGKTSLLRVACQTAVAAWVGGTPEVALASMVIA